MSNSTGETALLESGTTDVYEYLPETHGARQPNAFCKIVRSKTAWAIVSVLFLIIKIIVVIVIVYKLRSKKSLPDNSSTSVRELKCPPGYTLFEKTGYCYKSSSNLVYFDVANETCFLENAELTSIHSEEENDFVIGLSREALGKDRYTYAHRNRVWVGLTLVDGEWRWTDGSAVDYTNWVKRKLNDLDTARLTDESAEDNTNSVEDDSDNEQWTDENAEDNTNSVEDESNDLDTEQLTDESAVDFTNWMEDESNESDTEQWTDESAKDNTNSVEDESNDLDTEQLTEGSAEDITNSGVKRKLNDLDTERWTTTVIEINGDTNREGKKWNNEKAENENSFVCKMRPS